MEVLLIGGTGILSSEVCTCAIRKGIHVTTLNRGLRKEFLDSKADNIQADFINETVENLKQKINTKHYDVVVDFISRDLKQLKRTIEIIGEYCSQLFFISSSSCYSEVGVKHLYVESDDIHNDKWDYCIKKAECEDYLTQGTWPFKYTIVRPYVTYGKTRIPFQVAPLKYYTIVDRIKNDKPIVLANPNAACTLTSARDFAVGVVGLFLNEKAYNQVFHVTSDCSTTWGEVAEIIGRKVGKKTNIIEIGLDFLKSIPNPGFEVEELIGDKARDMLFDNSKIKDAVPEFEGKLMFDSEISRTMEFFEVPSHQQIDYLWNGRIDRIIRLYCKKKPEIKAEAKKIRNTGKSFKEKLMYWIGINEFLYVMAKKLRKR